MPPSRVKALKDVSIEHEVKQVFTIKGDAESISVGSKAGLKLTLHVDDGREKIGEVDPEVLDSPISIDSTVVFFSSDVDGVLNCGLLDHLYGLAEDDDSG